MKTLLICASPAAVDPEWIAALAVHEDMVIAVDGGGALCRKAGIVPDLLIGDEDSLAPDERSALVSAGTPSISVPADKDESDLVLALAQARAQGATRVTIAAAWGGRPDHTLGVLAAMADAADLKPRLVEPDFTLWVLDPSGRSSIELAGRHSTLSIFAFGGSAVVSATGVKWPLDNHELAPNSTLGLSNVITEADTATVSVRRGTLVVISPAFDGCGFAAEQ